MAGGLGFPRREDYLRMLEEYKEELEQMQREIGEELWRVTKEIEALSKWEPGGGRRHAMQRATGTVPG